MAGKMKKCKHCGAEIAKGAKVCPKCGGNNGAPKGIGCIVVIAVIAVISMAAVAGKGGKGSAGAGGGAAESGTSGASAANTAPAEELANEFKELSISEFATACNENAARAKEEYLDNYYIITGTVSYFDRSWNDSITLSDTNEKVFIGLKYDNTLEDVMYLDKGMEVSVKVKCTLTNPSSVDFEALEFVGVDKSNTLTPPEDYSTVTVKELRDAWDANIYRAEYLYKGHEFTLTGEISSIDENMEYLLLIDPGTLGADWAQLKLNTQELKDQAMNFNVGDVVTAKCKFKQNMGFFEFDTESFE